jgi:hypothetical protein
MSSVSVDDVDRVFQGTEKQFGEKKDTSYFFANGLEILAQTSGMKFTFKCHYPTKTISSLTFQVRAEIRTKINSRVEMRWEDVAENLRESEALRFARRLSRLWGAQNASAMAADNGIQSPGDSVLGTPQDARRFPHLSIAHCSWLCQSNGNLEKELIAKGVPEGIAKRCSSKNICHSKRKSKNTWLLAAYWRSAEAQTRLHEKWDQQNLTRCLYCDTQTSAFDESTKTAWKAVPGFSYTLRLFSCVPAHALAQCKMPVSGSIDRKRAEMGQRDGNEEDVRAYGRFQHEDSIHEQVDTQHMESGGVDCVDDGGEVDGDDDFDVEDRDVNECVSKSLDGGFPVNHEPPQHGSHAVASGLGSNTSGTGSGDHHGDERYVSM